MAARFELREDKDTGRKYWYGAEDDWKDATEIGDAEGTLILKIDSFAVGTVLELKEPPK